MSLEMEFEPSLRGAGFVGTVALMVADLDGTVLVSLNPERIFPAASTIKVPLMVYALQQVQAGRLGLDEPITLRGTDQVGGAGVLHDLSPGLSISVLDLLTLMIVVSDNTATNLLIDRLGADDFNVWLSRNGLHSTRLIGKLQLPPERQNSAQRRGERNRTGAADQLRVLLDLAAGRLLDSQLTTLALDILHRQHHKDLIGRGVPCDAAGEPIYRVASKSGELTGVHHDVGLLYTPRPLAVTLLSEGGSDAREHPENLDLGRLSRALWSILPALGDIPPEPQALQ